MRRRVKLWNGLPEGNGNRLLGASSLIQEMIIEKLKSTANEMTPLEGAIKLGITLIFIPICSLTFMLGGFYLDYYRLGTLPAFTFVGTFFGVLITFIGIYLIVTFGHKGSE